MSRAASLPAEVVYNRKVLFDGLTRSDLWELLAELGHKKTEEEANVIFDILDKDGNDLLDMDEFCRWYKRGSSRRWAWVDAQLLAEKTRQLQEDLRKAILRHNVAAVKAIVEHSALDINLGFEHRGDKTALFFAVQAYAEDARPSGQIFDLILGAMSQLGVSACTTTRSTALHAVMRYGCDLNIDRLKALLAKMTSAARNKANGDGRHALYRYFWADGDAVAGDCADDFFGDLPEGFAEVATTMRPETLSRRDHGDLTVLHAAAGRCAHRPGMSGIIKVLLATMPQEAICAKVTRPASRWYGMSAAQIYLYETGGEGSDTKTQWESDVQMLFEAACPCKPTFEDALHAAGVPESDIGILRDCEMLDDTVKDLSLTDIKSLGISSIKWCAKIKATANTFFP